MSEPMCVSDCGCAGGQPAARCTFQPGCPRCAASERPPVDPQCTCAAEYLVCPVHPKAPWGPGRPPVDPLREALDVRPEVVQWFHDGEEQCDHDYDPPPCAIQADALLESFVVEPRLYENKDGTVRFQREHFGRLHRAALGLPADARPPMSGRHQHGGWHAHPEGVASDSAEHHHLASPAAPACICGKPAPMAGTCFDINGDFWPGHGSASPAAPDPMTVTHVCPSCGRPTHTVDGPVASPAVPRPEGLDVERLTLALKRHDCGGDTTPRSCAQAIAREYQRLSDSGDTP